MPETADVVPARCNVYGPRLDLINNLLVPVAKRNGGQMDAIVHEDNEYQRLMFHVAARLGKAHGTGRVRAAGMAQWRHSGRHFKRLSPAGRAGKGIGVDDPPGRDFWPQVSERAWNSRTRPGTARQSGQCVRVGRGERHAQAHSCVQTGRSALAGAGGQNTDRQPTLLLGSGSSTWGLSFDARYSLGRDIIVYAKWAAS